MFNSTEEIFYTVILGAGLMIIVVVIFVMAIVRYQNKQRLNLIEKQEMQNKFNEEILKSQLEIQEQTLKHISQEIHDNIGQALSLAKLHLNRADSSRPDCIETKLNDSKNLITKAIFDLRKLSKSLDTDFITAIGLKQALGNEVEWILKSGQYQTEFVVTGNEFKIDKHKELILFRIVQEILNNILKHAQATHIFITLDFHPNSVALTISDNGVGFNAAWLLEQGNIKGLGLKNMQNRAKLINADFNLLSAEGKGTTIKIELKN